MKEQPLLDLPARALSPHEATTMAELILPHQREHIKELCRALKTNPYAETMALYGDGVNFHQLSQRSAAKLEDALRKRLTLEAFRRAYKEHNAPDHDKAACALCSSYGVTYNPHLPCDLQGGHVWSASLKGEDVLGNPIKLVICSNCGKVRA